MKGKADQLVLDAQEVGPLPVRAPERHIIPAQPAPTSMLEVIDRAIHTPGFNIEMLERLLAVKERHEANEARKAFVSAMNEFKKNPPRILKNKHVKVTFKEGGGMEYDHATLDQVCNAVTESLSTHGLSHRWETDQTDKEWIVVSCIITHDLGHSERTTLKGCPDISGKKNPIQAMASTVSYLERYTLLAATGLAAQDMDNDGAGAGVENDWLAEQLQEIGRCETADGLDSAFKAAAATALNAKDIEAYDKLKKARDVRKKGIR